MKSKPLPTYQYITRQRLEQILALMTCETSGVMIEGLFLGEETADASGAMQVYEQACYVINEGFKTKV
jgi:hypothetical protein